MDFPQLCQGGRQRTRTLTKGAHTYETASSEPATTIREARHFLKLAIRPGLSPQGLKCWRTFLNKRLKIIRMLFYITDANVKNRMDVLLRYAMPEKRLI